MTNLINKYLGEGRDVKDGLGADGMSKAKLKTLLYKETKPFTYNKLYNDDYWNGPTKIWDVFNKLNLNWNILKSEYKNNKDDKGMGITMPTRKEWTFEIRWEDNKGKQQKIDGNLTAAGAGSVKDPMSKYDLVLVLW